MNNLIELKVDEFTTPSPTTIPSDASYKDVCALMKDQNIRHLPVVDGNDKPVGIVSQRDVLNLTHSPDRDTIVAKDFMTEAPLCVSAKESLGEVAFTMSKKKVGSAVVTNDEGKLIGIFTSTDALNALVEVLRGDFEELLDADPMDSALQ